MGNFLIKHTNLKKFVYLKTTGSLLVLVHQHIAQ